MVNVDRCLKVLDIPQEQSEPPEEKKDFFLERLEWPESGWVNSKMLLLRTGVI